ncbi:cytochrome P450 [Penicillium alfredii]|uniref:Cytochrome P450 n=1 Tax=Penicillium alfredii TaxID=1506179 RepID=A0A9W9K4M1_9EURO|nr:cytochrome P450 [Penicillium alfredii]KAJ5092655.1 cytochrome P450 [Penicillium alfredii]
MSYTERAPTITYTLIAGFAVFLLFKIAQWVRGTLRPKAFPPGPPIIPGLGNLLDVPLHKPYLQFHKWSKEYGDAVGIKAGTGNLVILNTPALVYELFDKRGATCSDRPDSYVISKHVAYGPEEKQIAILQYDDYYKRWRKALQYILASGGVKRVLPLLEAEACSLTHKLLHGGDKNYVEHLQYWAFAVPLVITVGERLKDMPPEYMEDFFHAQEEILKLAIPGVAPPVDIFPILKYVPEFCCSWKSHARLVRQLIVGDANKFLSGGLKQFKQIQEDPSSVRFQSLLAKIMLDQADGESKQKNFSTTELGFAGQGMVAAAVDTTAATLKNLLVTFAAYPDILAKAQEEVDRVGNGTPPTSDSLGQLTYLRACISEILRWRPTTPSAFPHVLTRDESVGGYVYPKGTMLIANAWTIHRNEEEYDRPDEFIPERFIDNPFGMRNVPDVKDASRRVLYAFGSGRRQCPGELFAYTTISLTLSKLLWAYDILPPPGGVDISVETGFQDGLVTQPINPKVLFRLRDEKREGAVVDDLRRSEAISKEILGDS